MQQLILTIILIFSVFFVSKAQETKDYKQGANIEVTVPNVLNDEGTIRFALFDKENFRKKPLYATSALIKDGKSFATFKDIPQGEYAIICFHDENNNDRMDFEENGMPKESYGTSNNAMNFGPPQFENAKFKVTENNLSLEIKF
jgi:uncharacterized protein (DUF2141 family)